MSVFLSVLKMLLIVLLSLLALALLIVLLILFAPVVYGRNLAYDGELTYDVSLSWLFRFLYIKAKQNGDAQEDAFKLFWFWNVPKGEGLLALLKKIRVWLKPRVMYILVSVTEDETIASDPSLSRSAALLGKSVKGILKAVLPKDLRGEAEYGLKSPDLTGYVTAFLATVLPTGERLSVTPDFSEETFSCALEFHAKVFLFKVVYHVLAILLSKDVRRFLALISEKYEREVQNGQ